MTQSLTTEAKTKLFETKKPVIESPTTELRLSQSSALPSMHGIAVVNDRFHRHRCLSRTHAKKLQLLETCKNKLCDARRHSYRVKQV